MIHHPRPLCAGDADTTYFNANKFRREKKNHDFFGCYIDLFAISGDSQPPRGRLEALF